VEKAWIPCERHRDRSAVEKIDDQYVVAEPDGLDALTGFAF